MYMKKWFIFVLFPLVFACNKQALNVETGNPVILFQVSYMNNAWGYRHHGWIMDTLGQIKTFSQPAHWNFADSSGYYTKNQMELNLSQLKDSIIKLVDKNDVTAHYPKALNSENGSYSTPKNVMADAGVLIYAVLIYHPAAGKWKETVLFQKGDWETKNESPEAGELQQWLEAIGQKLSN